MMRDWLEPDTHFGNDVRIYVLAAASEDHEGADAPEGNLLEIALLGDWCKGQCVLLKDGLCTIHSSGFKPLQCRTAMGCEEDPDYVDNYTIAALWDTDEGHEVLALWERFK